MRISDGSSDVCSSDLVPEGEEGVIDLALVKVSSAERGWRMTGARNGKPSRTCWRVIEIKDARTLVEFMPETGRTHQIRVHAAEGLGVPVAGDPGYGRGGGPFLLHAVQIGRASCRGGVCQYW